ncbi:hypothetical protein L2E82_27400 [Cichorium intybus]|uniref:Uncharacterized protein n=1 Tax=Cichorium intybus TaxID=13427 RepID=A0ACB9CSU0_CICIN|nr:hypothetical protein L2E82_27400 [Cichorium intybus]
MFSVPNIFIQNPKSKNQATRALDPSQHPRSQKGFHAFWNWFDLESWHPLGRSRIIGGTLYPGIMVTAAIIYRALKLVRFAVHIHELWDSGAGLVAAALIAICPGYISRWVVGSLAWGHLDTCIWSAWGGYVFIVINS